MGSLRKGVKSMSKLKAIEICNFMSIGSARLEFDDSNIISICGYNDSGKSAITRLLEIMFYNAYSQDQASFIKDGTDYWGCSLEFDDGVEYNRYKYLDGKSEYELKKDGKIIFSNKTAQGTILAMDKVPEQIENYLGVISVKDDTMNEKLNVRRNTDKLFLINTTGGENYKMLNTILRSDLLAGASKKLNKDRNSLQADVSVKSTEKATLGAELETLEVCSDEALSKLAEMTKNLEDINRRYEYLQDIVQEKSKIDEIVIPVEVSLIDSSRLAEISRLNQLKEEAESVIQPECSVVDMSRLSKLMELISLYRGTQVEITPEVGNINVDRLKDIKAIAVQYNELYGLYNQVGVVEQELETTKATLSDMANKYGFKICKNCGTVVE